jgi:hypothetical protein
MSITTKAFRIALTAAALCAAGTGDADARARRVVVLDFDGPRALADTGRNAVVAVLGDTYEVVATKRWEQARVAVQKVVHGPQSWKKAAKKSGVDAVVEGWVQDEGRHKVLTLAVRDATTGNEIDQISFKFGKNGLSEQTTNQLKTGLDELLDWVEGTTDPTGKGLPQVNGKEARVILDAKGRLGPIGDDELERVADDAGSEREETPRRRDDDRAERSERTERTERTERGDRFDDRAETDERTDKTERKPTETAAADPETKENIELVDIFGKKSVEADVVLGKSATHVPQPTARFMLGAGLYYGARSLVPDADSDNVQDYSARSKGFLLSAATYPWPLKKQDGILSGIGFSFKLYHSAGSEVGADTEEEIGNYAINQNGFQGAIHWRQPLGMVSIDGEVGYGHDNYTLPADFPADVEVPDVQYSHVHAGGHLDLHVTERATIGFGGSYLYILDTGDLSSLDWYGPGQASGFTLDANFVIPLPKQLYVRGELGYKRITTDLDGAGLITEEEAVLSTTDATMNGSVNVGIQF